MTGFIVHLVLFVLLLLWLPAHANAIFVFSSLKLVCFFNETCEQLVETYLIIIIYNNNSF